MRSSYPELFGPDDRPVPSELRTDPSLSGFDDAGQPLQPAFPPGDPRGWDLRQGFNLQTTPRTGATSSGVSLTPFQQLRNLADYDLVRIVIEDVKGQILGMERDVQVRKEYRDQADSAEVREEVEAAREWLDHPDMLGGLDFEDWLGKVLEEILVTDALAMYPQYSLAGDPIGLVQIDGTTIKPIVDDQGRPPLPPLAAYQQVIRGRVEREYDISELWYLPRNRRVDSPYGRSPVENVIITVNLAIRTALHELSWHTEGNLPDSLYTTPKDWNSKQIKEFQEMFDDLISGNAGKRAGRLRFIPGGDGAGYIATKDSRIKYEDLEWLARVIAWSFQVSPMPVAKIVNRATAETMESSTQESGTLPVANFARSKINLFIQGPLQLQRVEMIWGRAKNEQQQRERHVAYVGAGIMTRDEARKEAGHDPLPDNAGGEPTVDSGTGPVFLADLVRAREKADSEDVPAMDPEKLQRAFLEVPLVRRDELRAAVGLEPVGGEVGQEFVVIQQQLPGGAAPRQLPPAGGGDGGGQRPGPATKPADPDTEPGNPDTNATDPDTMPVDDDEADLQRAADADLRKWRRVAKGLQRRGKRQRMFVSKAIPVRLQMAVAGALQKCSTPDQVAQVFRQADERLQEMRKADPSPVGQADAEAGVRQLLVDWIETELLPDVERWALQLLDEAPDPVGIDVAKAEAPEPPIVEKHRRTDRTQPRVEGGGKTPAALAKVEDLPGLDQLDFDLSSIFPELSDWLTLSAQSGLQDIGASAGIDLSGSPDASIEFAKEHAAELVGRRWVDGKLVENPDPQFAIGEQLRSDINDKVTKAITEGWSPQKLSATLQDQLVRWRAQTIARTETAFAYGNGALVGFEEAGVELVEILDGPGCLPKGHNDGAPLASGQHGVVEESSQANGQVWTRDQYAANITGHPNCVRAAVAFIPETDEGADTGDGEV